MDFLGIGPLELIVVLIIALIVVGPERLPQLAQSVGKTVRDLRAMSQGFATEWQREMNRAAQLNPGEDLQQTLTKPFKEAQADLQRSVNVPLTAQLNPGEDLQQTLTKPFKEAQADLQRSVNAPLTSPSKTTTELPPREAPPQEESTAQENNPDHVDA
jgi:Tat protein translocase TatB subunit